jgi:tetratricopeptide (TPR) repeat protein
MVQGRLEEALVALRRAAELDPLSPRILDNFAWALVHAGRPEEALAALDRALALQPDALQATSIKAQILARQGRRDEAMALLKTVPPGVWISSHWRVMALGLMGDAEARRLLEGYLNDRNAVTRFTALLGLGREEEALRTLVPGQIEATRADVLLFDPIYDRVRADPRFTQALAAIGLAEAHARAQAWRAKQQAAK